MFAHIQLGVQRLEASVAFYDAVLLELGWHRITDLKHVGQAGVIWKRTASRWPQFVLNHPFNGLPATTSNGSQVSFLAPSRSAVDAAWKAALDSSGHDVGPPGVRPHYASDFFAAYCLDLEGHKLCFVHTDS